MRTPKKNVLDHLIKQIPPYIVTDRVVLREWSAVAGKHIAPGVFEKYPGEPKTMHLGDKWTTGYDETMWYSTSVSVPEHMRNKKLYLVIDFGGEAIVRINGEIAGGVSSNMNSGWVHRDKIFFPDPLPEVLNIEVEATVNSGGFCDTVLAGSYSTTYTLARAEIQAVDEVVESYYNDICIVSEAIKLIDDEAVRAKVYAAFDDSLHAIDFDFEDSIVRPSFAKAAEILWKGLDSIKWTSQGEVIMTGHSHIDVAWLWTTKEVQRKCARTFSNTIELLKRYPDATFVQSQAVLYNMVKKTYPELMPKIKELVDKGQWDIIGNSWVEADTNIASGESLIRQLLYGEEFFRREFGVTSDTYWLPDCFGFSSALPQIIKKCGMKYFITAKLNSNDTNRFPYTLFNWRGTDGSEILGYCHRTHYGDEYNVPKVKSAWSTNENKGVTETMLGMYGYSDGGGGPTYGMVENGRRISKIPGLPASKTGHVSEFFDKAQAHRSELPVWEGELYFENHRGTYTSQGFIKKNNRRGEFLLTRAEAAGVISAALNGKELSFLKPDENLTEAWELLLINQFHDILPGTSIPEAMAVTKEEQEKMLALGSARYDELLTGISAGLPGGVACFNMLSVPVTALVTAPDGTEFVAEDLPPMGYRVYSEPAPAKAVKVSEGVLENEYLRAEFNCKGQLVSLIEKSTGREALSASANILTVYADKPVHESAWNMEANYVKKSWPMEVTGIEFINAGSKGVVRVNYRFHNSTLTQDIVLAPGARRLDFVTQADWFETEKTLRADFPVSVLSPFATFDIAHGAVTRPTHRNTTWDITRFEVSAHKWADMSEGDFGVSILNDCKYGYSALGNTIGITLLRSPNCPDPRSDKGHHSFTYSIYPHKGGWQEGKVSAESFALNLPPVVIAAEGKGNLPEELSFVNFGNRTNIQLDCLKPAQAGGGIILRVYETSQCRGTVDVTTALPFASATETDMLERPIGEEAIPVENGKFSFDIKPFEVKTFLLK
ncbi:MAG: alpha-mannosidase [Clostridia bacterium]|nr:alpha-mannosidase [Clostridia bacterium]